MAVLSSYIIHGAFANEGFSKPAEDQVMAHWDGHLKASKPPDALEMHIVFVNEQPAPGLHLQTLSGN